MLIIYDNLPFLYYKLSSCVEDKYNLMIAGTGLLIVTACHSRHMFTLSVTSEATIIHTMEIEKIRESFLTQLAPNCIVASFGKRDFRGVFVLVGIQEKLGILNKGVVYAVFDYTAHNDDELSFVIGDTMTVLRKGDDHEDEWWWAMKKKKKEGYIPRNLLGVSCSTLYRSTSLEIARSTGDIRQ